MNRAKSSNRPPTRWFIDRLCFLSGSAPSQSAEVSTAVALPRRPSSLSGFALSRVRPLSGFALSRVRPLSGFVRSRIRPLSDSPLSDSPLSGAPVEHGRVSSVERGTCRPSLPARHRSQSGSACVVISGALGTRKHHTPTGVVTWGVQRARNHHTPTGVVTTGAQRARSHHADGLRTLTTTPDHAIGGTHHPSRGSQHTPSHDRVHLLTKQNPPNRTRAPPQPQARRRTEDPRQRTRSRDRGRSPPARQRQTHPVA